MAQEIDLGGTIYISSKRAAEITGYTQDYVGQLCRGGLIQSQRVSGHWYVTEASLREYKEKADQFKPEPPKYERLPELEASVSFDGKDYVSAQRAAKITGYHQDYVGQLARSGKVLSRQIGNRWYVDREGVVEHKKHNDALLAAVQASSVGLERSNEIRNEPLHAPEELHYTYSLEESIQEAVLPEIKNEDPAETPELATEIPIRIVRERTIERIPMPGQKLQNSLSTYSTSSRMTIFSLVFLVLLCIGVGSASFLGYVRFPQPVSSVVRSMHLQFASASSGLGFANVLSYIPDSVLHIFSNNFEYERQGAHTI